MSCVALRPVGGLLLDIARVHSATLAYVQRILALFADRPAVAGRRLVLSRRRTVSGGAVRWRGVGGIGRADSALDQGKIERQASVGRRRDHYTGGGHSHSANLYRVAVGRRTNGQQWQKIDALV